MNVPAGTFECVHYRINKDGKQYDAWYSKAAASFMSPFGAVRASGPDFEMELEKVLVNEPVH